MLKIQVRRLYVPVMVKPRRFAGDLFVGMEFAPPDRSRTVQIFDVDDTLTRKPDDFQNVGMTKDEFFDAARDFPPDVALVEQAQLHHRLGDRVAIATARPAERLLETIEWLRRHDVPFDQIMLSNGRETSGIAKQAMIQKLQDDYKTVGALYDDSPFNIEGAAMQGVHGIHLRKNDEYWDAHPETVYPYGR